jgi:hypothetical protein
MRSKILANRAGTLLTSEQLAAVDFEPKGRPAVGADALHAEINQATANDATVNQVGPQMVVDPAVQVAAQAADGGGAAINGAVGSDLFGGEHALPVEILIGVRNAAMERRAS